ncbi:hypothetical protein HMPREF1431_01094 [Helicobacter pylori GAMchJs106B]|nr:hypothetical protein HMPREF1392_00941 [Helicobacter pylori GAM101Biv]EMH42473.1 hypothetical protein HMPREF1431_01094 [Helicobacter pylori GAMchJs106B]
MHALKPKQASKHAQTGQKMVVFFRIKQKQKPKHRGQKRHQVP